MIYLAILWAVIGIIAAAIDFHYDGLDFTIIDAFMGALLGPLVVLSMVRVFDIVILRGKK